MLAMYSEPSGSSAQYRADKLNFDIAAMPIGKSGKPITAGGIGLISVAAIKDEHEADGGDGPRALSDQRAGGQRRRRLLPRAGRAQVGQGADPINKFDPYVEPCYITPIIAEWPQIRTIIHPNIQNAVFGKMSAKDAMAARRRRSTAYWPAHKS